MTRLALLIPAFNAASFLPRLLGSAAKQTRPFDETWVYDDCSTDGTADVASQFGARVVRGDVNRGCSHAKNALAKATACEWLHFHDADDALKPRFVERAREWMARDAHDVVLFAYEEREADSGRLMGVRTFDPLRVQHDATAYAISETINPFCGLYRRTEFLRAGGYDTDPNVLYNEDAAMHIGLAIAGLQFAADPEPLVINYRRPDSMSAANPRKCIVARWNVLKKAARAAHPRYDPLIAEQLWKAAAVAASLLDWRTADSAATHAARMAPPEPGLFKVLTRISPRLALRARECLIRAFRPHLRGPPA